MSSLKLPLPKPEFRNPDIRNPNAERKESSSGLVALGRRFQIQQKRIKK